MPALPLQQDLLRAPGSTAAVGVQVVESPWSGCLRQHSVTARGGGTGGGNGVKDKDGSLSTVFNGCQTLLLSQSRNLPKMIGLMVLQMAF